MNAIELNNLTKYYGKARGIVDLNLTVEEGAFYGFIGPNGAGKSTTIRILLGLIQATSGTARLFGKDPWGERTETLKNLGYLPSETMFYGGMKVREVLRFSAELRGVPCEKEAERLCARLDLDVTRKIDQLSLGNRKKVGIVCALQHRPKLFIFDEPTSGLDPLIQREFYAILREQNQAGATVFLSSHILSEVQRYCTHAAVIREGKLLVADRVEQLGATGTRLVTLQGAEQVPALPKMKNLTQEKDTIRFLYGGEPKELLKALSEIPLQDVTITEPDLEEVFLHYYAKEGEHHDDL